MIKVNEIPINTSTLEDGTHSTSIDFTSIGNVLGDDYFNITLDDSEKALNASSSMTVSSFVGIIKDACNEDSGLASKATFTNNENLLTVVTKDSTTVNIAFDYHRDE
jgi:hypothetical protein|tara:strand:- start:6859 stop:7179 length:321 start_codon:yes stop_codon:yes gene_type:complete